MFAKRASRALHSTVEIPSPMTCILGGHGIRGQKRRLRISQSALAICCASGGGATTANAYFFNLTTGTSTSVQFTAPSRTKLAGTTAEWIVESPAFSDSAGLADYGEVFFSPCTARATDNTSVSRGTGSNINMTVGEFIHILTCATNCLRYLPVRYGCWPIV